MGIEHADVAFGVSGVVDPQKMGAIEDAAGDNEDNESEEDAEDEAADIGAFSGLIWVGGGVPGRGSCWAF